MNRDGEWQCGGDEFRRHAGSVFRDADWWAVRRRGSAAQPARAPALCGCVRACRSANAASWPWSSSIGLVFWWAGRRRHWCCCRGWRIQAAECGMEMVAARVNRAGIGKGKPGK